MILMRKLLQQLSIKLFFNYYLYIVLYFIHLFCLTNTHRSETSLCQCALAFPNSINKEPISIIIHNEETRNIIKGIIHVLFLAFSFLMRADIYCDKFVRKHINAAGGKKINASKIISLTDQSPLFSV